MNESKPSVLVMTAVGSTGMQVALHLLDEGFTVHALVRREDDRSDRLKAKGAKIFVGSLADLDDMRLALSGCRRAYFCAPITAAYLRIAAIFATVAREQKLETVVVMSQWLSSPRHPALQTRECWLSDQILSMLPETSVITVNPGFFADNELQALNVAAMFGMLTLPYGAGLNAAPSNEDMARVISTLLARPEGHAGKTYRITGPKLLSPDEIAATMSTVLGRKVRYVNAPVWMLAKVVKGLGYDDFAIAQTKEYWAEYRRGTFAIGAPTDAVLQITGSEAEDYETTARRYAAHLPKNTRTPLSILKMLMRMGLWMARPAPKTAPHLATEDFVNREHRSLSIDSSPWRDSHAATAPTPSGNAWGTTEKRRPTRAGTIA